MDSAQNLPAAIDKLYAAVSRLVDQRKDYRQDAMRVGPSLYETLLSEIPSTPRSESSSRGVPSSRPPVWCDALDLRRTIDDTARDWAPGNSTPARLRAVAAQRYRPEDTGQVTERATLIESWSAAIAALIDPGRVKTISAPCPACGADRVYRDRYGEQVRQPALQLTTAGCTCGACNTTWPPDQYLFLCRLLGFDLPAGVIG